MIAGMTVIASIIEWTWAVERHAFGWAWEDLGWELLALAGLWLALCALVVTLPW